ncbi:MAG: hypothetical protein ACREH4_07800 [Vitreimonas sp.]
MGRRSKVGALTAMIIGVLTALAVGLGAVEGRWSLALHLSSAGVEVSAESGNVRVALTL